MLDYTEKKNNYKVTLIKQVSFFYFLLSKSYFRILRLNLKSHKTNLLVTLISKKKKKVFFLIFSP